MIEKEKLFHDKRIAFYVDDDMTIRYIPKGLSHAEYFNHIKKPEYIKFIWRGYILYDHAMIYVGNDFSIPKDISIQRIFDTFSAINSEHPIKWMGLGCIIGEIGEEWKPKIVINALIRKKILFLPYIINADKLFEFMKADIWLNNNDYLRDEKLY